MSGSSFSSFKNNSFSSFSSFSSLKNSSFSSFSSPSSSGRLGGPTSQAPPGAALAALVALSCIKLFTPGKLL